MSVTDVENSEVTEMETENTSEEQQKKPTETVDFWKQKAREQEKRAQENAAAAQRLAEIEEANKSEAQKPADRLAAAEKEAADARTEALRLRIAAKHGISDEDAETFLTGSDEAALTRQAERLAALATTAPTTPKPDRTQGGSGEPPALNSDALEDALRNAVGAR